MATKKATKTQRKKYVPVPAPMVPKKLTKPGTKKVQTLPGKVAGQYHKGMNVQSRKKAQIEKLMNENPPRQPVQNITKDNKGRPIRQTRSNTITLPAKGKGVVNKTMNKKGSKRT